MTVDGVRMMTRAVIGQVAAVGAPDFGSLVQGRVDLDKYTDVLYGIGTANGQADRVFLDSFSIAASGTLDYDLNGGSLTDPFGVAVSFVEIVGLWIFASAGNSNNVVLSTAAANPWLGLLAATDLLPVRPGDTSSYICGPTSNGLPVVAGTGDVLRIANSGGGSSIAGDLLIVGRSA